MPGELGNAFYFGHSSDFPNKPGNYKTVFALLPRIELDDEIMVSDEKGRVYTYKAIEKKIVKPTQTEILAQGNRTKRLLTLQTSYPIGTAISRFIVVAKLAE
jgi:LPXTG-site transpeptidase (sortase) family protein